MTFQELWRPIETGDPDKIGFCHGGARQQKFAGCVFVFLGVASFGLLLLATKDLWSWVLDAVRMKEYRLAAGLYVAAAMFALVATESLLLGIWLLLGRTDLLLDRKKKSITKNYRLRSFCLYRKKYAVGAASVFIFRHSIRSFAPIHFLRLKDASEKRRYVFSVARGFAADAWKMADRMAAFFEIPLAGTS